MATLASLKREVIERLGRPATKWADTPFFGGAATAQLTDGNIVSLLADPPPGTPHIAIIDEAMRHTQTVEEYLRST